MYSESSVKCTSFEIESHGWPSVPEAQIEVRKSALGSVAKYKSSGGH